MITYCIIFYKIEPYDKEKLGFMNGLDLYTNGALFWNIYFSHLTSMITEKDDAPWQWFKWTCLLVVLFANLFLSGMLGYKLVDLLWKAKIKPAVFTYRMNKAKKKADKKIDEEKKKFMEDRKK